MCTCTNFACVHYFNNCEDVTIKAMQRNAQDNILCVMKKDQHRCPSIDDMNVDWVVNDFSCALPWPRQNASVQLSHPVGNHVYSSPRADMGDVSLFSNLSTHVRQLSIHISLFMYLVP